MEAEGPDGHVFEFPDGTAPAVVSRVIRDHYARPRGQRAPAQRAAAFAHGGTFGFADEIAGGVGGLIEGARELARPDPRASTRGVDRLLGRPNAPETLPQRLGRTASAARRGFDATQSRFLSDLDTYREERPIEAGAVELGGGLLSPAGGPMARGLTGLGARGAVHSVTQGAAAGGLYALGTGGEIPENVLGGAALGGAFDVGGRALGSVAGGALELWTRLGMTPEQRAVRLASRALRNGSPDVSDLRARGMSAAQARQGITEGTAGEFTIEDALSRANRLPSEGGRVEETLADIVPGFGGPARALHAVNGPGRSMIRTRFAERRDGAFRRSADALRAAFLPNQTHAPNAPRDFLQSLRAARRGEAGEMYRLAHRAELDPQLVAGRIAPIVDDLPAAARRDAARSGGEQLDFEIGRLRNLLRQASDDGARADLQQDVERALQGRAHLAAIENGGSASHNSWSLDYFGRGLRQVEIGRGRGTPEAGSIASARNVFNSAVDDVAPILAQTRTNYGASMRVEDAVMAGRQVAAHPERLEDSLASFGQNIETRDGFMSGLFESLQTRLEQNDTAFVFRVMRNRQLQQVIDRAARSPRAARALRRRITREAAMRYFENYVTGGTQTTPIAEDVRALTDGEAELSWVADLIRSGGNATTPLLRRAAQWYERQRQPGINNPAVNRALANILMRPATRANVEALRAEIDALPSYANLGPLGRRTGAVMGRLGGVAGAQQDTRRDR